MSSWHESAAAPASETQATAASSAPASVWVMAADDLAQAEAWCEALAVEGLAVEMAAARDPAPQAISQAAVLFCTQRLTDHLGSLRDMRQAQGNQPVLAVGRALRELEQVLALEMGADDVIDAGVSAPVVAARLRALWRRAQSPAPSSVDQMSFGRLSLYLRERRVQLGPERIGLTECEFEVLWLLAAQAGRAVSRAELLERLRGLPYQRIDRSIDSRVYRIRAKLGDGEGAAQHIRTVRNCGYLFSPARW